MAIAGVVPNSDNCQITIESAPHIPGRRRRERLNASRVCALWGCRPQTVKAVSRRGPL